ncbi:CKLF-like MARVEL transmembrane domain-containing protein 6 [Entelurus aequoreus]|uniref:CKLF-like MARVEL transmembrane domain-containing protein 6 n=1 Tax=Entelurus aequoreus TaxID=161455 RepID=UPI002B1E5E6B|nr:CKLF-like MARVEL transmembrane domain-containing protein 6 [Entelurus aequoreus]
MASDQVYSPTTAPNPGSSCLLIPSQHLSTKRFILKVLQVLMSLVAFILEELVYTCVQCTPLEFFEFVSFAAFLFTLALVIVLSTKLHTKLIPSWVSKMDFVYTSAMALLFLLASIVFAALNGGTALEKSAAVFGFLATAVFLFDVVIFWRTCGHPFCKGEKAAPSNSNLSAAEPPTETEKLNTGAKAVP